MDYKDLLIGTFTEAFYASFFYVMIRGYGRWVKPSYMI
jgi:hypothetical protein